MPYHPRRRSAPFQNKVPEIPAAARSQKCCLDRPDLDLPVRPAKKSSRDGWNLAVRQFPVKTGFLRFTESAATNPNNQGNPNSSSQVRSGGTPAALERPPYPRLPHSPDSPETHTTCPSCCYAHAAPICAAQFAARRALGGVQFLVTQPLRPFERPLDAPAAYAGRTKHTDCRTNACAF